MGDDINNEKKQGIIFSADGADAMNNQMFGKTITGLGSIMEEEGVDKTGAEAVVPSTVAKAKKISVLIPPSQPNCKSLHPGKKRNMTKEIDDITTGIQSMSSSENSNATLGKDNSLSVTMKTAVKTALEARLSDQQRLTGKLKGLGTAYQ